MFDTDGTRNSPCYLTRGICRPTQEAHAETQRWFGWRVTLSRSFLIVLAALIHYIIATDTLLAQGSGGYLESAIERARQGNFDGAIADCNSALSLKSQNDKAYYFRGLARWCKGDYDGAIADLNESIRINPSNDGAYWSRGKLKQMKGELDGALADFREAFRLNSSDYGNCNSLAWFLATCQSVQIRDGQEALKYAKHACDLTQYANYIVLDTLAAACAEAGNFESAVQVQSRALLLAPDKEKADYRSRLELYHSGQPYRQPTGSDLKEKRDDAPVSPIPAPIAS